MNFSLTTIGIVHSPFKQKFAIPRQPNLAPSAQGWVELLPPFNQTDYVDGLDQFSHIWLSFIFHQTMQQVAKPRIRPPRLGGNQKIGVFASRSTFRPNPLGLSVVSLLEVERTKSGVLLHVGGLDLVDQTPIVDIKPYIPYVDSVAKASAGYAQTAPHSSMPVQFSAKALSRLSDFFTQYPLLKSLIEETLQQDPRPAYKQAKQDPKEYGMRLYDFDVLWTVVDHQALVKDITPL